MPRSAETLCALCLLVGCGAREAPPVHAAPQSVTATGNAPLTIAADTGAIGQWSGPEWGRVTLHPDGTGTYTDTYGTGPGRIEFRAVGDGYDGRWMESSRRFGTLHFVLDRSGQTITGTWAPDPECTIGTTSGGSLRWTRERASQPQ